ncbi:hypothetical protein P4597_26965 [Peribacillus simplex]|uniref:hypothetical protein n=1 Tax=Peribacillus simplex TaxID=1478 RepID=UPI002E1FE8B1|nr:hypothetical protein [Peribacillus simplex]
MASTYTRTITPGGKQVSTANQVIDFAIENGTAKKLRVQFLNFRAFAQEVFFRINDEVTVHWVEADSDQTFRDIDIDKITIVNAGVEYYFTAMSTE